MSSNHLEEKGRYFIGSEPSLKEKVYNALRSRIISGELPPGTKLSEESLCAEMGISRAPLREAFNMLDRDGFVDMIPRKGSIVADFTEEDVAMIWDIRLLLEPNAAVMSMHSIPPARLKEVRARLETVLADPGDFRSYIDSDIRVHSLLMDYLENHYLVDIMQNVKEHSVRMRWNVEKQRNEESLATVIASTREHLAIVDAFLSGEEQAVFDAVRNHLLISKNRTMKMKQGR